ncbi:MAG: PAS domain-containing protein [Gemmatimonadota bacterium]|nr:MAG: PAS domain-containing protein [Gemmatimonadota bacterium]
MTFTGAHKAQTVEEARSFARVPSTLELLRWVYIGRVMVAIVVFVAAAFSFKEVPPGTLVIIAVTAIASVLFSVWSLWFTHIGGRSPKITFLYSQSFFDLALVTTVVHVTADPASEFPALYILVIAVSAMLMPLPSSLLVTALASALYVADMVWWQGVSLTGAVFVQLAVFLAVFLVTGLVTGRVREAGAHSEKLQQEVHRLRLEADDILRNIRSGVLTVDGEGKLAYANDAALELLDLREADVLERPFRELIGERSVALGEVVFETQRRRVKSLRADGVVKRSDRTFPIGVTTTALDLDDDGSASVTAIFTDISDQKRVEELRLRAERLEAVAELSASLAHEIKNPLASIRSSVEQLASSRHANEDERLLAGLVVRESDRLSGLLSEFLDFSRVRVTDSRPLELATVVTRAVELVRNHPDSGENAQIDISADPVSIEGDEDLIHRVVVNLVLNAIQASGGSVTVQVRVRMANSSEVPRALRLDGAAVLEVVDDGPGIPPELEGRVFEPFVTGRAGGSGLGLAIVQRAVQAHRGAVFVESEPNRNTTFTVYLPTKAMPEVAA